MKVTDLNGCPIEVTDLNEAIRITKRYKKYRHKDESYSDYDKKQNVYWTDMYEKLTTIKEGLNNN
ncbi:hypothetical protein DR871_016055 [Flavobacterium petrolei]|uniref:3-isopropylmalate dehydratase n=1 Tax=Flavobacterium petrolei TaxID=2259594 RepID=A0A482TEH1_9FLAO|nr:hypothetical protein [Flavobacterium petrolei]RYJ50631.1 hypothetical protein DR871_016055 [Flavobacterium petrolei]